MFNIIEHSNLIKIRIKNSNILDLYSGIGSFRLECISREAKEVSFIEDDKNALKLLQHNVNLINKKKVKNSDFTINIFQQSVEAFFDKIKHSAKYDVFFFDPPFNDDKFFYNLEKLKKTRVYDKEHLIIIHRDVKSSDKLDKLIDIIIVRKYGRSKIIFGTFN